MAELDKEERAEIIKLAEQGMPMEEILETVEAKFRPAYKAIILPQPHEDDLRA